MSASRSSQRQKNKRVCVSACWNVGRWRPCFCECLRPEFRARYRKCFQASDPARRMLHAACCTLHAARRLKYKCHVWPLGYFLKISFSVCYWKSAASVRSVKCSEQLQHCLFLWQDVWSSKDTDPFPHLYLLSSRPYLPQSAPASSHRLQMCFTPDFKSYF